LRLPAQYAPPMSADQVLAVTEAELCKRPKSELIHMLCLVRAQLIQERQAHQDEVAQLREQLAHEVGERTRAAQREINQTVNNPARKNPNGTRAHRQSPSGAKGSAQVARGRAIGPNPSRS